MPNCLLRFLLLAPEEEIALWLQTTGWPGLSSQFMWGERMTGAVAPAADKLFYGRGEVLPHYFTGNVICEEGFKF